LGGHVLGLSRARGRRRLGGLLSLNDLMHRQGELDRVLLAKLSEQAGPLWLGLIPFFQKGLDLGLGHQRLFDLLLALGGPEAFVLPGG